jgi:hypothetical protein
MSAVTAALLFFFWPSEKPKTGFADREEEEEKEQPAEFIQARLKYEYDLLKSPRTGKIPDGILEQEKAFAKTLPVRSYGTAFRNGRMEALNTYIPAGPNNIGGRTRAVEYDRRYNGTTNRVIIAGCVSGGIMRSADGGNTWTLVTPDQNIHNLTALAQDPRPGFENTWYAGSGEFQGYSAWDIGAPYLGFGLWKSTDNGVTWTKLTNTISNLSSAVNDLFAFDHPMDFTYNIVINPVSGDVYVASWMFLLKSTDGGNSFKAVFQAYASDGPLTDVAGQTHVAVSSTGRVYLAVNGAAAAAKRGVWYSETGELNTFTRIAGGQQLGTDSVAGWRGNAYGQNSKRILIALAPSNTNIGYVYYENGLSATGTPPKPEADFYRFDVNGTSFTWTNRSANMPDFPGGDKSNSDPLTVQGGYDMELAVKPDNPTVVFIGGTNLYRSTDAFATTTNTAWIAGYEPDFSYSSYGSNQSSDIVSHPDIHHVAFRLNNTSQAICANDGGIQETMNIMNSSALTWRMLPRYQTLQCYNVSIDPGVGRNNFASGSQDNGVRFRDKTGVLGTPAADSNNHQLLLSADGAFVGISLDNNGTQYLYSSIQLGRLYRSLLNSNLPTTEITPTGLTTANPGQNISENQFGEFVTNLRLESDNTNNMYYINFNRLFRTTAASTVTKSTWTELTGVSAAVNPGSPSSGRNVSIRGVGISRGPYNSSHTIYLGTTPTTDASGNTTKEGQIFRLDDPQNAAPNKAPVNITPAGLTGNVQDIAVNPNNDDEVIAVVSNYDAVSVWWTKNGKSAQPTWKNAEGNLSLPSFRSCAIVVKKDAANQPVTEYYVGTSIGLYSTTNLATVLDAGGSPVWQREGSTVLNYALVTSLAYRPADNVMVVGTHGNGIFYTNLGTPNFTPNLNTAITPVTNDRRFVQTVYPTLSTGANVQYQIGNMIGIRTISVQVINLKGQVVFQETRSYQSGSVPLQNLPAGVYILNILSEDNKYRHIQKLVKQ